MTRLFMLGLAGVVALALVGGLLMSRPKPPDLAPRILAEFDEPTAPAHAAMDQDLEKLERHMASLERKMAQLPPPPKTAGVMTSDFSFSSMSKAKDICDLLSLEEARREAFLAALNELIGQIRSLESQRSKVVRKGNEMIIKVDGFPEEARRLKEAFDLKISGLLTFKEKRVYDKLRLFNEIFSEDFGTGMSITLTRQRYGNLLLLGKVESDVGIHAWGSGDLESIRHLLPEDPE